MDLTPKRLITEGSFFSTSEGDLLGSRYANFSLDIFSVKVSNTAFVPFHHTIKSAS